MATYTFDEIRNAVGKFDNIHDFYKEDISNNFYYLECLRKFYLTHTDLSKNSFITSNSNLFFLIDETLPFKNTDTGKVNKVNFSDYITDLIIKIYPQPRQLLSSIQSQIVQNFNEIFDIPDSYLETILLKKNQKIPLKNTNINQTISDDKKILLRQPLYFLIKTKDKKLIDFFLNFIGLSILSANIISIIMKKINENLTSFDQSKNILYPSTYFDDMATGILPEHKMRFKILNKDKHIIDQAGVEGEEKYLDPENSDFYLSHFNFVDSLHSVGFSVKDETFKINFLKGVFYKKGTFVYCEFDKITIKVKENKVGRNKKNTNSYGLYQALMTLHKLIRIGLVTPITKPDVDAETQLADIVDTDNMENILNDIIQKYKTEDICVGFLAFMLFGAKRFGDWVQAELSKKYYFMLQTTDHYCKLYSYLIGAPVIIGDNIYNYELPTNFSTIVDTSIFQKFDKTDYRDINKMDEPLIFRDIREFTTPLSRYYFDKYIKYKNKYLELKKLTL